MRIKLIIIGLLSAILFAACNKEEELIGDVNAKLAFSADSVLFDTVFTSVGSTSRRLKIYNPNEKAMLINTIRLSGGNLSPFSLNINGQASAALNNLKLNGNDSIYVFVKVNINPTTAALPFIVQDSIIFNFNGKQRSIPLIAYGQNAIFINNSTVNVNTNWDSKLPYIIYQSVTVAENANLTIAAGAKVLFHGNATMSIKGTLTAMGTAKDSIVFASDRLEQVYANESGQWNGLHFYPESKNSVLKYAVVKNAVAGITVDSLSLNDNPKLVLANSVVKNMEVVGFLGYQTELAAFNNLFFNCGQYLLYGAGGGKYNLKQNTFAGYNPAYARKTAALYLSDAISATQFGNLSATLYNNIIWGNLINEFLIDQKNTNALVRTDLKNNLIKTINTSYNGNGNLINIDPKFTNPLMGNFRLTKTSTAIGKGFNLSADSYFEKYLSKDLTNKNRLFPSSLGCYEF